MLHRSVILLFLLAMIVSCGSSAPIAGPAPTPAAQAEQVPDQYLIGPGDQLKVTVWQHEDLSPDVTVLPDGEISMPLVGEIKAAGMSEKQLAAAIKEKLSEYVRNPEITITVTNPASDSFRNRVRVTGAVTKPASVPYRKGMTVLDVVLEAGGPNEFASANGTKLYRTTAGATQVLKVYLDDILKKGRMETNYELQPSDVVTVPERLF